MLRPMRRALPFCLVLALASLSSSTAFAEGPSAADKATAKTLATEGDAALKKKDFQTAFTKFDEASRLVPDSATVALGLARAQVGLGKPVDAKESYNNVIRAAGLPGAAPAYKAAQKEAEKDLKGIDAKIGGIVITVDGPGDATLTVDGSPAKPGERKAVNPGDRVVKGSAPGFRPAEEKVTVKEGADSKVTLKLEKDTPKEAPKVEAPVVPEEPPPPAPKGSSGLRTAAWISAGVGVAGLAVGGVFGFLAKGKHDDLKSNCLNGELCPMSQKSNIDSFKSNANISTIGFIVGGVGVVASIPLFIASRPSKDAPPPSTSAFLTFSPSSVAVSGSF